MREELVIARLREEYRATLVKLRKAAEELIVQQDIVNTLAATNDFGMISRHGLTDAQHAYDRARRLEQEAWNRLHN